MYQVYGQLFYAFCALLASPTPSTHFASWFPGPRTTFRFPLRLLPLRTATVAVTTLVAMAALPFFHSIVGFNGAISFRPLTVYCPIRTYMVQTKVTTGCPKWWLLQCFSILCLLVTVVATVGSVADIVQSLKRVRKTVCPTKNVRQECESNGIFLFTTWIDYSDIIPPCSC
ncbi:hypothetical protein ACLOJK_017010 [Asimina triloba]